MKLQHHHAYFYPPQLPTPTQPTPTSLPFPTHPTQPVNQRAVLTVHTTTKRRRVRQTQGEANGVGTHSNNNSTRKDGSQCTYTVQKGHLLNVELLTHPPRHREAASDVQQVVALTNWNIDRRHDCHSHTGTYTSASAADTLRSTHTYNTVG